MSAQKGGKSSNRLCLKSLAPPTVEVLKELGTTSSEDAATYIISQLSKSSHNEISGQDTIRRRIYDVINVLSASGIIDKVGKQIVWRGFQIYNPKEIKITNSISPVVEQRIANKEKSLREKVRLLTLYKVLIARNFIPKTPKNAVYLPSIIIGVENPDRDILTPLPIRSDLEILTKSPLLFISPLEILQGIDLDKTSIHAILRAVPEISHYGSELLQ